jgi:IclR family KDG regulon transcriptional repressor
MPDYEIDVLRKSVLVLRALAGNERGIGVSDLGRTLGIGKASVFRILHTLAEHGFVRQDPDTKAYALGPALIALGQAAADGIDFRREARPAMEELTADSGMPSYLNVPGALDVVCLEYVPSLAGINLYGREGLTMPYHACPSGLVLLAYGPPERLERVLADGLRRYATRTIVGKRALRAELERVRAQGYSLGIDDLEEGVTSIAAPVRDVAGRVVGSLGLAGFSHLFDGRTEELTLRVRESAAAISVAGRPAVEVVY